MLSSCEHVEVWYPFKSWGKLSYSTVGGVLAEETGYASKQTWRRRRRWRLALQKHPDFLVAVLDRSRPPVVEAWTDTPDHEFASVVLRSDIGDDVSVWTHTYPRRGGVRLFRLEPGQSSTVIEHRSGRMVGWSTILEGCTVDVLHPEHLTPAALEFKVMPLQYVLEQ